MRDALLALAEEPGLWTPPAAGTRVLRGDGFALVCRHGRGTVEALRVPPAGAAGALVAVRALARAHDVTELVWWVGDLAPPGLADALAGLGLEPYAEEPLLLTLVGTTPPPPVEGVLVRPVDDLPAYRRAMEVDWEAWGLSRADRRERRRSLAADWEALTASGRVEHRVAEVDGRPAGFARLVMTDAAGVLMGGAVVPWARGRGAYRALVHARWLIAAARGTPRLVTSAGAMSAPVLARLGFAPIGRVRLLRDPFV